MTRQNRSSDARWWPLLMLPMLVSAALRDLWAPDEPRYGEVAREIYETGSFLVMHLCGQLYPDKPPLLFWTAGFTGWLGGWSELALRIPSLVATAATAWLVSRIARRWWGDPAATWAPAVFLTTAMVTEIGGRLQIDPLLTVWCTVAMALVADAFEGRPGPVARVLLAGLAVGIAGLAKGPVGLVNVGIPVALWAWLGPSGALPRVRPRAWLGAAVLAMTPMLVWALAASAVEPSLASELFFGQHAGRVTQGDRHPGPLWKHLVRMPPLLLPWTGAVVFGLAAAWRTRRDRRTADPDRGLILAGLWLVGLFVFYSAIPPKRDLYLLPAYPAAALLAARAVTIGLERGRLPRWVTVSGPICLGVLGALLAVAGPLASGIASLPPVGALAGPVGDLADLRAVPGAAWRSAIAGLGFLAAAWWAASAASRHRVAAWARAQALGWMAAAVILMAVVFPPLDPIKSARPLALDLARRTQRPAAIPTVGVQCEGYRFYTRGAVPTVLVDPADLDRFLEAGGDDFLALVRVSTWPQIPDDVRARLAPAAVREVGGKDIFVVTAASAPPAGAER